MLLEGKTALLILYMSIMRFLYKHCCVSDLKVRIVSYWSKCFRSDFPVEYWAYLLSQTPQMMDEILAEQVEWSLRDMCLISSAVALIHFEKWIWRIGAGRYLVAQIGWWKIRVELRRRCVNTHLLKLYSSSKISRFCPLILLRHWRT